MDSVRKIVNCTPEQYLTLLKEGQVEINGEVKTKEDGTLYNPGELPLLEWHNKIMEAQYAEYAVAHTPIITKPLEKEVADLILAYPEYRLCSCIAYKTFLNKGDIIGVASRYNNGEVYINGTYTTSNYNCKTDGEVVNVVVFESGVYNKTLYPNAPKLGAVPSYHPYEFYIKHIGLEPEVAEAYYLYANKITTYGFILPSYPRGCRVLVANGTTTFSQKVPIAVQEVSSNCESIGNFIGFNKHGYVNKISLPNCREISVVNTSVFVDNSAIRTWEFGKLQKLSVAGSTCYIFDIVNTVLIPDTVRIMSQHVCRNIITLRLECNKATSIDNDWYVGNIPTNFTMTKEWDASVNIAIAAKNWTKDRFLELFENLVPVTMGSGGRELTIPATIFDNLTEEEYALAEDKGWVLGGA